MVGEVLTGYLADRGWERPIAQARVFTDWEAIVGSEVAAHCAPTTLHEGELKISAESTAWATQLRMLGGTLLARVVAELGPTVVTRIVITGPTGPSWKHGKFTVRGQRGPRDTYG
ncbi:MAG: putative RNA-binding protein containing Zn ribbon [Jatrophihabitans sp.]|nr:putative RNA-binding protein containing Zn ribbon [Jatrophihabitans sp.]